MAENHLRNLQKRKREKLTKSEQMARVRSHDTGPEVMLRKELWGRGIRYRIRLKLPGTPDVVFPRSRVAIFIDGCFWHGCPIHYGEPATNVDFWRQKISKNMARDRNADEKLRFLGWKTLRIWEHEIIDDLQGTIRRILDEVEFASAGG